MLGSNPRYRKSWKNILKREATLDVKALESVQFDRLFLSKQIQKFLRVLRSITVEGTCSVLSFNFFFKCTCCKKINVRLYMYDLYMYDICSTGI